MADEIQNGTFNSGGSPSAANWLTGTSQHNLVGVSVGGQTALGGAASPTLLYNEFQYVNAAFAATTNTAFPTLIANPGWTPGTTSETYSFSFQYDVTGSPAHDEIQLYYYNKAGAPPTSGSSYQYAPGSLQDPIGSFTSLCDSGNLSSTSGWVTVTCTGLVTGDPEYFAVVVTEQNVTGSSSAFTDVSLTTQSQSLAPVPEPASLVMFGSGLLGLGGIIRRKLRR
jgi:hypothetical protein